MAKFKKGDKVRIKREHRKDYEHLEVGSIGTVMATGPQGIKVRFKTGMPGWIQEAHLDGR